MSRQPAEIKARIDYDRATQSDPYERWRRGMVAQTWGENDQT